MVDINKDLRDYLSRNDKNSSTSPFISMKTPSVSKWFANSQTSSQPNEEINSSNGWFSEAQKDPLLPSLSKRQRIMGFILCLVMGIFCFTLAGLYVPFLLLKARKFALLYTLGSLFIVSSFSLLWGPVNHIKHLCSSSRLPFTTIYFGTMFATLYFALEVKSTILTVVCAISQIVALVWYIVSYIPGGQTGLKFFSKVFSAAVTKSVQKTLPV